MLKDQKIDKRMKIGNEKAAAVIRYINHRKGTNLVQCELHEDVGPKLDYRLIQTDDEGKKSDSTFQVKVRDERKDIIYETHKFIPTDNEDGPRFRTEPGRDALCKADFYICKPHGYPEVIHITRTKDVKKLSDEAHKTWRVADFTGEAQEWGVFTDDQITEWWRRARFHDKKQTFIFSDSQGTSIYFKIDEGPDTRPYGKFLSFVRSETLEKREDCYLSTIKLNKDEEISRPETWETWRKT